MRRGHIGKSKLGLEYKRRALLSGNIAILNVEIPEITKNRLKESYRVIYSICV